MKSKQTKKAKPKNPPPPKILFQINYERKGSTKSITEIL